MNMESYEPAPKKPRSASLGSSMNYMIEEDIPSPATLDIDSNLDYVPLFYPEMESIMRGFGDCEEPQRESVILVEKIVLEQMRSILFDVIGIAVKRKGKPEPNQRDFEFLMRRNPTKILRLRKYLNDVEWYERNKDLQNGRAQAYYEEYDDNKSDNEDEEIPKKYDEEKTRRLFRADRISKILLDSEQYAQFIEARTVSFYSRSSPAVREKLIELLNPPPEAHITAHVYTILSYLVHETIATIVDLAILTRLDGSNREVYPFDRITCSG